LWLGILGSFAYLLYQYIPKAIALNSMFAPDYVNYIFYGKISGVLAGTFLIIGLLGGLLDASYRLSLWSKAVTSILWLIGTVTVLYAYVFIFDTRNGIGLAALIYGLTLVILLWRFLKIVFYKGFAKALAPFLLIITIVAVSMGFGAEHIKHNPGWSTTWEDAKISLQLNKYPNWQNPQVMGYPQNVKGELVKANTYERVAWGAAGLTIFLPQNLLGVGILSKPFSILLKEKYPNAGDYIPSTHSAWVEIALAFGIPGLCLLTCALSVIFGFAISSKGKFRYLCLLLSFGMLWLYTVGEVSSQHSIEMLFYFIALMTVLLFPLSQEPLCGSEPDL
jgi:O-antigen ligase